MARSTVTHPLTTSLLLVAFGLFMLVHSLQGLTADPAPGVALSVMHVAGVVAGAAALLAVVATWMRRARQRG